MIIFIDLHLSVLRNNNNNNFNFENKLVSSISFHCNGKKMCNLQGALQFIWIFIYQNIKISHRCFLEIFNLKWILSRLFLRFVLAMPEFCNNRVILTANYVMISKPIFLQVSPTERAWLETFLNTKTSHWLQIVDTTADFSTSKTLSKCFV